MNDFYQGEEVLPAFTVTAREMEKLLGELIHDLGTDIGKTRSTIEQLEKDPRKDGLQSADLKHAKNMLDMLQRDLFDATIWANSLDIDDIDQRLPFVLTPNQARWIYRYEADRSIRHRSRK